MEIDRLRRTRNLRLTKGAVSALITIGISLLLSVAVWFVIFSPKTHDAIDDQLFSVNSGGKFGYINITGDFIIRKREGHGGDFVNGVAIFERDGKFGFIDLTGNEFVSPEYDRAMSFFGEYAFVQKNDGRIAKVDRSGLEIVILDKPVYSLRESTGDMAIVAVTAHGARGLADIDGNFIIEPSNHYLQIDRFHENLSATAIRTDAGSIRYGFVNKSGDFVISPIFTLAGHFNESMAPVRLESGEWIYINKSGNQVFDAKFSKAQSFSDGVAWVWSIGDESPGLINSAGVLLFRSDFSDVEQFSEGFATVSDSERSTGVIDRKGQYAIPPGQFDFIGTFHNGLARASQKDTRGWINSKGEWIYSYLDKK